MAHDDDMDYLMGAGEKAPRKSAGKFRTVEELAKQPGNPMRTPEWANLTDAERKEVMGLWSKNPKTKANIKSKIAKEGAKKVTHNVVRGDEAILAMQQQVFQNAERQSVSFSEAVRLELDKYNARLKRASASGNLAAVAEVEADLQSFNQRLTGAFQTEAWKNLPEDEKMAVWNKVNMMGKLETAETIAANASNITTGVVPTKAEEMAKLAPAAPLQAKGTATTSGTKVKKMDEAVEIVNGRPVKRVIETRPDGTRVLELGDPIKLKPTIIATQGPSTIAEDGTKVSPRPTVYNEPPTAIRGGVGAYSGVGPSGEKVRPWGGFPQLTKGSHLPNIGDTVISGGKRYTYKVPEIAQAGDEAPHVARWVDEGVAPATMRPMRNLQEPLTEARTRVGKPLQLGWDGPKPAPLTAAEQAAEAAKGAPKSGAVFGRGAMRGIKRGALKVAGKGATKALAYGIPIAGEVLAGVDLAMEAYDLGIGSRDRERQESTEAALAGAQAAREAGVGTGEELLSDLLTQSEGAMRDVGRELGYREQQDEARLMSLIENKRERMGRIAVRSTPSPAELVASMMGGG